MKNLKLSYTIVTYNNEDIIENTVMSIIENTPKNVDYTLYIVDNCSTDNTVNIIKHIEGSICIIDLLTNKGFGYGHNQILDIIDSDYHFVINPDITISGADNVSNIITHLNNNPRIGLLLPLILNPDKSIQYLNKLNPTVMDMFIRRTCPNKFIKRQNKYMMKDVGYDKEANIEYGSGSFMVFRTSIFKEIEGFDDSFFMYLEDADITRRVNQISESVFFPGASVVHDWARAGHQKLKYAIITVKSMIIYFNKWGWKWL